MKADLEGTHAPVNVLLVDDQPDGLLSLEAILEHAGHRLITARSGREALKKLLHVKFAVVLLDVQMPDMDGYETATLMRGREQTRDTPIIFLTASEGNLAQVFHGYEVGAVDFVIKPVVPEILRSKVSVFAELARKDAKLRELNQILTVRAEELVVAKEHAEAESRVKSQFLAGMSHELRTPLNSIIGFSELLEQELFGPLNEKQMRHVRTVIGSGRHLLSIVNDILDLSKIEAGKMALDRKWTAPEVILDAVRGVIEPVAAKQGVTFELMGATESLPELYVDALRLKQVLFNLVTNGIKFTPRGGSVTLRLWRDDEKLAFVVSDTGIGIAASDQTRLFQEFEQISPSQGVKPEGTGLGLALTKRLVEMHGGTISLVSEPGHGSTFTVYLPVVSSPDRRAAS